MKLHGSLITAAAMVLAATIPAQAQTRSDKDRFQGAWDVVWVEAAGKRSKPERTFIMFDGKRCCYQDSHGSLTAGFYLDETGRPKTLDLVTSERTLEAIYAFDGDDLLKVCDDLAPNAERPRRFSANRGTERVVMLLKRNKEISITDIRSQRLPDGSKGFPTLVEPAAVQPPPKFMAQPPGSTREEFDQSPGRYYRGR